MVGYNRRFSPFATEIKKSLGDGPMALTYRVNAGAIPPDSWIQDPEIGGGRILGEVCHFIDFLTFINGSLPSLVFSSVMDAPTDLQDVITISLKFRNGSIGSICYFANGAKSLAKERVEVFAHNTTAIIDDFKTLTIHTGGKNREKKLISQDKGQKTEVAQFVASIISGKDRPISFDELYSTSLVCFKVLESLRTGQCISLEY